MANAVQMLQGCVKPHTTSSVVAHHPVPYLQHAPHAGLQRLAHVLPLLGLQHLVVGCLQVAEDLQVPDVDAGPLRQLLQRQQASGRRAVCSRVRASARDIQWVCMFGVLCLVPSAVRLQDWLTTASTHSCLWMRSEGHC